MSFGVFSWEWKKSLCTSFLSIRNNDFFSIMRNVLNTTIQHSYVEHLYASDVMLVWSLVCLVPYWVLKRASVAIKMLSDMLLDDGHVSQETVSYWIFHNTKTWENKTLVSFVSPSCSCFPFFSPLILCSFYSDMIRKDAQYMIFLFTLNINDC